MPNPTLEYTIRSKDESKAGVSSATKNADTFRDSMHGLSVAMRPVNQLAGLMMGAGAIGGIMMVFNRVSAAAAACEKSFISLHPEMKNAAGSAASFGMAAETLKASIGGVISGALSPFREAFVNMIAPTAMATQNLKEFRAEYDTLIAKYSDEGQRAILAYNQTLKEQDSTEAQLLAAQKQRQLYYDQLASSQEKWQQAGELPTQLPALKREQAAIGKNLASIETIITGLNEVLDRQTQWLARNKPGGGVAGYIPSAGTVNVPSAYNLPDALKTYSYDPITNLYNYFKDNEIKINWASAENRINDLQLNSFAAGISGPAEQAGLLAWLEPAMSGVFTSLMSANGNPTGGYSAGGAAGGGGMPGSTGNLTLDAAMGNWSSSLIYVGSQFTSVGLLMDPLKTALGSMTAVMGDSVNTALTPLVGIVTSLGGQLGQVLVPIVQGLSPIIQALADGFTWLWNKVLVPVGNGIWAVLTGIINMFVNLGIVLWDIITFNWAHLGQGLRTTNIKDLYAQGPLTAIDPNKSGAAAIAAANAGGATGASASYTQARDITVNVTINTDVITGEGGFRELAIKLEREIQSVLALGLA
jgi:hypothetical protein